MYRKVQPCLALCLAAALAPPTALAQRDDAVAMDTIAVSATRAGSTAGETPQKITVITREEIEAQTALSEDPSQVLSKLIPSFSPARQKLTNSGETFRGRDPLFMIDGVPQSNPLRNGSRAGYTIDLSMVERIEVIHGASAEHGLGATGGIINFVTRRPDPGSVNQHVGVSVTAPTDYESEGLGYKLDYRVSGAEGDWDYLLGGSYQGRGMYYDTDGDLIGVDDTQGDVMDSESIDLLAKLGYWIDDDQNLELMLNRFELEGNGDYVNVPGDRSAGTPATSVKGNPQGEPPSNKVTTASLAYKHGDLFGTEVSAKLYSQRFRGQYGGGDYGTFQDPAIDPSGKLWDQSRNESDKLGAKFTVTRRGLLDDRLDLTGGLDLLRDKTRQMLTETGREWVPETEFRNYAPFLQATVRPLARVSVQAGVRHEYAELKVDDFRTLASYNGGQDVAGGNPDFEETLYNIGVTVEVTDGSQIFANYSEGFGMPDVGRVLRGIDQPNQDVDSFLNLAPIVTDNREIGFRMNRGALDLAVSYFESDSDFGSRLARVNGVYEVRREKTEIHGVEISAGWQVNAAHRLEADYAYSKGRYDSDDDGDVDTDLLGRNIAPNKLLLRWNAAWTGKLSTMLQAVHHFERDFDTPGYDFDGYTLVDASVGYRLPVGRLSVGLENLLNEEYISYYSQAADNRDASYYAGRGRTITVGYKLAF
ncbi:TonB-dependent receptor [Alkalilimnicola sp. S0819]|uniref:TonB-dependent receptor n=1 Tax=Alkalilimnicola sp. S0819 TaxID=2613922 RepID=UPI001261AA10|nr:TonB-dependent receptor [Alkalilimnicola sp. S0819]KAB7624200.1 TonB-dependent receptor [Alkalilimnicola sp. S0819]MPQ16455.1 TonB-dependent receptor [Alkalilimnicola sp. S0819]